MKPVLLNEVDIASFSNRVILQPRYIYGDIMRYISGIIIGLISLSVYSDTYRYPEIMELDITCNAKIDELELIEKRYEFNQDCPGRKAEINPVDLNKDGKCEYFVTSDWGRRCTPFTSLLKMDNDGVTEIYEANGGPINTFAEKKNGYPKLIHYTWGGHRTNPIFTANVYSYNGEKYVCEFCKDNSHGGYIDLAKRAYENKNYDMAELYYWNAYAMNGERKISDANNLALTYIKQDKHMLAVKLLDKYLALSVSEIKERESQPCYGGNCIISDEKASRLMSSAKFNRDLAEEKLGESVNK